jgi:hypothetical protein
LATGDSSQDVQTFDDDCALFNIETSEPEEVEEDNDFEVFHDAQLALEVFFAVQTQWNYSMDGITGLNYSGVISVIELYAKKKARLNLLHEVSAIERGYLKGYNEKRKK